MFKSLKNLDWALTAPTPTPAPTKTVHVCVCVCVCVYSPALDDISLLRATRTWRHQPLARARRAQEADVVKCGRARARGWRWIFFFTLRPLCPCRSYGRGRCWNRSLLLSKVARTAVFFLACYWVEILQYIKWASQMQSHPKRRKLQLFCLVSV